MPNPAQTPVTADPSTFQPFGTQSATTPAPVQPTPQPTQNGVTADTSTFQPFAASTAPATTAPHNDELQYGDSVLGNIAKTPLMALEGAGEGVFKTAAGASDILDRATGMTPGTVNRFFHAQAGDNNTPGTSTWANKVGNGLEDIGEFMTGDELLKGLSVGDRLLKIGKITKTIEQSPLLTKAVSIGMNAIRNGVVGTAEGAAKSSGDPSATVMGGGTAGLLTAGLGGLGETINILRNAGGQEALQNGFRNILAKVAADNGVAPADSGASLYNTVKAVADNVAEKSRAAFKALDDATEGRFQRFENALDNISKQIAENEGIDDGKVAELEKKHAEVTAAQQKTFEDAKAKGVDPSLIDQAKKDWRTKSALNDLSNRVLPTVKGTPPEIASKGSTPERMNANGMFDRAVKLYHTGRLADALGNDNATALVKHLDQAAQAANTAKRLWSTIKFAAPAALSGYGGLELLRDIIF
jgi:hypothetical protein